MLCCKLASSFGSSELCIERSTKIEWLVEIYEVKIFSKIECFENKGWLLMRK
jgi:hypothetical protein